jgi:hypothetical protein
MHDSGSGWVATPFLCDSFTPDGLRALGVDNDSLATIQSRTERAPGATATEVRSRFVWPVD